jgi:hypothetical protein
MTNRQRLLRCVADLRRVADDPAISPTPYQHLLDAIRAAHSAAQFVLDINERDRGGQNVRSD